MCFNSFINVMVQIVEKYGKTVLQGLDCAKARQGGWNGGFAPYVCFQIGTL